MGQLLTTFGINWKLLLTQVINFGLLLLALRYFLYGPIMKIIDERKDKIAKGVVDAEAATVKLATAETEKESIIKNANGEAEKIVAEARVYADQKGQELVKEA